MQMLSRKNVLLITAIIILVAGCGYVFFFRGNASTNNSDITDEEIMQRFSCNRATLEARSTDVYCQNPDLYRQDVKNGTVRN